MCWIRADRALALNSRNLVGSLPDSITLMTALTSLVLNNNGLSGALNGLPSLTGLVTVNLCCQSIAGGTVFDVFCVTFVVTGESLGLDCCIGWPITCVCDWLWLIDDPGSIPANMSALSFLQYVRLHPREAPLANLH